MPCLLLIGNSQLYGAREHFVLWITLSSKPGVWLDFSKGSATEISELNRG